MSKQQALCEPAHWFVTSLNNCAAHSPSWAEGQAVGQPVRKPKKTVRIVGTSSKNKVLYTALLETSYAPLLHVTEDSLV